MFIYTSQAPSCFQFTKKLNKWNSGKVYLLVCGCFAAGLWLFDGGLWWFVVIWGGWR